MHEELLNGKANVRTVAQMVAERSRLFDPEDGSPFTCHVAPGGHARLLVIAGENASGKSLFFQVAASFANHLYECSPITVSIRERTGGGTYEGAAFRRAMMFGNETEQSTGATSARTVLSGFANVKNRVAEGKGSLLLLDEPELGLSRGYARALGRLIARETLAFPVGALGTVVVTHDRGLVEGLRAELGEDPAFVCLGAPLDLATWLTTPEERSVDDLLALPTKDKTTWRTVETILGTIRKEKKEAADVARRQAEAVEEAERKAAAEQRKMAAEQRRTSKRTGGQP